VYFALRCNVFTVALGIELVSISYLMTVFKSSLFLHSFPVLVGIVVLVDISRLFADIVNLGGLPLIVKLCKHFEDDINVTIMLVNLLSNISVQDGMLQHFFVTGKMEHCFVASASF
jgi:hypothetical protein